MKLEKGLDIVIIIPPAGAKVTIYPPYGAMYIASALRKGGFKAGILNVDVERIKDEEVISRIKDADPAYIAFSGIVAPSYKYIKTLSLELKKHFTGKLQILGGGLSSAFEPVLNNTAIDIVVQGEGDLTSVELLSCLKKGGDPGKVPGIYLKKGAECVYTGKRALIANLDSLAYPAFDLVDMDAYMPDGIEFIKRFTSIKVKSPPGRNRMITISTSRGCFGKCTFCFRAYPGIRLNSMEYVFDFVEYCMDKLNAGFFSFGDECFAANKERNWQFIEEYKRRKMDFAFRILGMRVDTIDKDILRAYNNIGCWMIEYGFESGCQKILNIIDKRVSVEQNRRVALWTDEVGIYTSPTLVLAMPGETRRTVGESIDFLKSLCFGFKQYQWSYALPIPGSTLYEFAMLSGTIKDEDEYLASLSGDVGGAGVFHVNLTDEPDEIVAGWADRVRDEVDSDYFRRKYKFGLVIWVMNIFKKVDLHLKKGDLLTILFSKSGISRSKKSRSTLALSSTVRFRKRKDIVAEDLIKGMDSSSVNRDMSLRNMNERLKERLIAERSVITR